MSATEHFKNVIEAYLEQRAEFDKLFAVNLTKPEKNISDCITYILNWVQQSGCNGFTDEEIFSQAVHYFDEDDIEIGNPINCKIAVNHVVELTEEEKAQARKDAMQQAQREYHQQLTKRNIPTKPKETKPALTLFDDETEE